MPPSPDTYNPATEGPPKESERPSYDDVEKLYWSETTYKRHSLAAEVVKTTLNDLRGAKISTRSRFYKDIDLDTVFGDGSDGSRQRQIYLKEIVGKEGRFFKRGVRTDFAIAIVKMNDWPNGESHFAVAQVKVDPTTGEATVPYYNEARIFPGAQVKDFLGRYRNNDIGKWLRGEITEKEFTEEFYRTYKFLMEKGGPFALAAKYFTNPGREERVAEKFQGTEDFREVAARSTELREALVMSSQEMTAKYLKDSAAYEKWADVKVNEVLGRVKAAVSSLGSVVPPDEYDRMLVSMGLSGNLLDRASVKYRQVMNSVRGAESVATEKMIEAEARVDRANATRVAAERKAREAEERALRAEKVAEDARELAFRVQEEMAEMREQLEAEKAARLQAEAVRNNAIGYARDAEKVVNVMDARLARIKAKRGIMATAARAVRNVSRARLVRGIKDSETAAPVEVVGAAT